MNSSHSSGTREVVFDTYLVELKRPFYGEPWSNIEQYAERIWMECREVDDPNWESIKSRVQADWLDAKSRSDSPIGQNS